MILHTPSLPLANDRRAVRSARWASLGKATLQLASRGIPRDLQLIAGKTNPTTVVTESVKSAQKGKHFAINFPRKLKDHGVQVTLDIKWANEFGAAAKETNLQPQDRLC